MAKNNNLTDFLTDTANHIRSKAGINNTTKINPQNFSNIIDAMPMLAQEGAAGSRYRKYTHNYTQGGDFINLINPYDKDYQLTFGDGTPTCVITILTITIHTPAESGDTEFNGGSFAIYCGSSNNNEISVTVPLVDGPYMDMTSALVYKYVYCDYLFPKIFPEDEKNYIQLGIALASDGTTGHTVNVDMEYQQIIMPISNARFSAATCKALPESEV